MYVSFWTFSLWLFYNDFEVNVLIVDKAMFLNHSIPFFLSLTNWLRLLTFLCWFLTLMLVFLLIRIYFQLLKLGLVYTAFVFSRWLEWFRWTYHSASAAVDEFYEWFQVGIDIYILQQKVYGQVSSIFVVFSSLCSSHYS